MNDITFENVRQKCVDGRFFPYDSWHDRIFVPPAMILTWLFVRFGVSGNAVSWLSGFFVIVGAFGLASSDLYMVVLGSFGYIVFYLLDYVDGAVSRYNGTAGISGQYLDWVIHIIASVATMAGIITGAFLVAGAWIFPFAILGMVAAALTTGRYSMGWFAICMERQQRCAKGSGLDAATKPVDPLPLPSRSYWIIRYAATAIFHENYIIFTLPILAFSQLFLNLHLPDFRVVLVILSGTLYFVAMIIDIQRIVSTRRVEEGYRKLFITNLKPDLPKDHFF